MLPGLSGSCGSYVGLRLELMSVSDRWHPALSPGVETIGNWASDVVTWGLVGMLVADHNASTAMYLHFFF